MTWNDGSVIMPKLKMAMSLSAPPYLRFLYFLDSTSTSFSTALRAWPLFLIWYSLNFIFLSLIFFQQLVQKDYNGLAGI